MVARSATHVLLIPSYNPGARVFATVSAALREWNPVWVVVDGSTDGSDERLGAMAATDPALRVIVLPRNMGKGAAVLHGLRAASAEGFTHALTMDSDGQHPADRIAPFMQTSQAHLESMVLGSPHCASKGARFPIGGPISKLCGPASTTRCTAFASIRSARSSG
jgi:hypothetical protein